MKKKQLCYKFVRFVIQISFYPFLRLARAAEKAYNGMSYLSYVLLKFECRDDDIFIATYPKAGTTLLQMMLYLMTRKSDDNFEHIESVAPWFEETIRRNPTYIDRLPSPRIFKTHLPYSLLPKNGKFVYCTRNPKDSNLSYYYHLRTQDDRFRNMTLDEFTERFAKGKVKWGSWFKHLKSWWPHRHNKNVLFLQYEGIVSDLPGCAKRVQEFLEIDLTEKEFQNVVEKCSFDYMKKYNSKFDPRLTVYSVSDDESPSDFIRKGLVGEGKAELSPNADQFLQKSIDRITNVLKIRYEEDDTKFITG
jgi:hypothetical protein